LIANLILVQDQFTLEYPDLGRLIQTISNIIPLYSV